MNIQVNVGRSKGNHEHLVQFLTCVIILQSEWCIDHSVWLKIILCNVSRYTK